MINKQDNIKLGIQFVLVKINGKESKEVISLDASRLCYLGKYLQPINLDDTNYMISIDQMVANKDLDALYAIWDLLSNSFQSTFLPGDYNDESTIKIRERLQNILRDMTSIQTRISHLPTTPFSIDSRLNLLFNNIVKMREFEDDERKRCQEIDNIERGRCI